MRTALPLAAALLLAAGAAQAEWRVDRLSSRMADKPAAVAVSAALAPDAGISAKLEISCLTGRRGLALRLSREIFPGRIGLTYRIDDRPVVPRIARMGSDLHVIPLFNVLEEIPAAAKRFRIEVQTTGGPIPFFEFEISGIKKAETAVICN